MLQRMGVSNEPTQSFPACFDLLHRVFLPVTLQSSPLVQDPREAKGRCSGQDAACLSTSKELIFLHMPPMVLKILFEWRRAEKNHVLKKVISDFVKAFSGGDDSLP